MVERSPNSSIRGFLVPGIPAARFSLGYAATGLGTGLLDTEPLIGQSLEDFMQQVVVGVTGLEPTLVRERWQAENGGEPANLPAIGTTWAAVGIPAGRPLGFPAETELTTGAGSAGFSQQSDQEEFDLLCSFYGPQAALYCARLRQGLMIAQNRECLQLANVGLVTVGGWTKVPALIQSRWMDRYDRTATFNREIRTYYPILTMLSAQAEIRTDVGFNELT